MQEIAKNIYVETSYLCPNVGCILTENGAVLIDSPFLPGQATDWNNRVCGLSEQGISYLINTDHHFDHMLGNCYLSRRTIAHRVGRKGFQFYLEPANLKKEIGMFFPGYLSQWDMFAQVEIVLPQIIFSDEMNLYLGNTEFQLKFVGGHSPATIWIYIASKGLLFAGDNIENYRHPAMVFARFDPWIALLKRIEAMNIEIIVPGHGPIGGRDSATRQREYLEEMMKFAKSLKSGGMCKEDTAQRVTEHMLSYLPVSEDELEVTRSTIISGANKVFEQIR